MKRIESFASIFVSISFSFVLLLTDERETYNVYKSRLKHAIRSKKTVASSSAKIIHDTWPMTRSETLIDPRFEKKTESPPAKILILTNNRGGGGEGKWRRTKEPESSFAKRRETRGVVWSMMSERSGKDARYRRVHVRRYSAIKPPPSSLFPSSREGRQED